MDALPPVPEIVHRLVEQFREHRDNYHRGDYNETQLRRDYLDPLFEALGWDFYNRQGYAEAYRDVIHEDALRVEKTVNAPDYCFRIGGVRKFFVEAKRPSVDLRHDPVPAFQLRRYAWTAKLPLSILTDFEDLAVYDCRVKPDKSDKASTARIKIFRYTEYIERWHEIAGIFSREAILRGAFDKYAESTKKKRGTADVDEAFLEEIESWREQLARNLSLRNQQLSDRELNFAVQRIIDRIVFLRMCEGRGIEPFGRLQALLGGPDVYPRLIEMFHRADEKYNSGLFHFQHEIGRGPPDELTTTLAVDDKTLKDILARLYYPESPYEFAALPADILGQVYEQFLGKVIRLTPGHRAKIEEKPEVRKAGGVYYTPTYIVDYIVQNTVGKLVKGRSPKAVGGLTDAWQPSKTQRPLAVLDPACGSGSFLIVAYQFLLDWYHQQYTEHDDPAKHARGARPRLYQTDRGEWRLTTAERKRILVSHIFGVDVDRQAVEVTKLSLLLKVLEGETETSLAQQRKIFHKDRALPDLAGNIKCGNSLIGKDFYDGRQLSLLGEEDQLRINVFNWTKADGFPEVMAAGGFDAVIGNPPYIRMEAFKELKAYLRARYKVYDERADLYAYFIEREHQLLRPGGMFGMIVSNKFLRANYGHKVRELIDTLAQPARIVDLAGLPVFRGATVRTLVLITERGDRRIRARYSPPPDPETFRAVQAKTISLAEATDPISYQLPASAIKGAVWNLAQPGVTAVMRKMERDSVPLATFVEGRICRGVVSGLNEAFVISGQKMRQIIGKNPRAKRIIHPFLQGRCIGRYTLEPADEYLIYTHHGIDMAAYPAVLEHLRPYRKSLQQRATKQAWYELQQPQFAYKKWFDSPKIIFPDIATSVRFALDTTGYYCANTVYFVPTDNLMLLGLLNSRAAAFYFKQVCAALEGPGEAYLRFFGQYLESFPVKLPTRAKEQARFVRLVQQMLDLQGRSAGIKVPDDWLVHQRLIEVADDLIDEFVYGLYGLTDDEIRLVKEAPR